MEVFLDPVLLTKTCKHGAQLAPNKNGSVCDESSCKKMKSCFVCVCLECVRACLYFIFFPLLSFSLARLVASKLPSRRAKVPLTRASFTKSTVASAPSGAPPPRGTAARPRRRTARYTACCAATGRCKPRRESRPERWPPSPEP